MAEFVTGIERRHKNHLGYIFPVTVALHFFVFYFSPHFEFAPYLFKEQVTLLVDPFEQVTEYESEPEEEVQPTVEFTADEIAEEVDIREYAPTSPADISRLLPAVRLPEKSEAFYHFSKPPVLVKAVAPVYPVLARIGGFEGRVLLSVLVGEDGRVLKAEIVESDLPRDMEEAAVSAARKFIFEPAYQGSVPVKAYMRIPVVYRLN